MGRRCYVLLRRRHDVPIRRPGDVPLRRLGAVLSRCRWVFHLRRTCDVTGTYRETLLLCRHDVLLPGGLIENVLKPLGKSVLIPVELTAASSSAEAAIHIEKCLYLVRFLLT